MGDFMREKIKKEIERKIFIEWTIASLRKNKCYNDALELIDDLNLDDLNKKDIDYISRIYLMPFDEIYLELKRYDDSCPRLDELVFVSDLMEKYNVSRKQLFERIFDVRRIDSFSKLNEKKNDKNKVKKKKNMF